MESRVVFADSRLKEAFDKLKDSHTEDKNLYKWLNRAFDDLSETFYYLLEWFGKPQRDTEKNKDPLR